MSTIKELFDEHEYKEIWSSVSSDNSLFLINFIESRLLPLLKSKESFIDIGAGPGQITEALCGHFRVTTVVEPNVEFLKNYRANGFQIHPTEFQLCDVSEESFDFILCSHVLYHVGETDLPLFLDKFLECLKPGGLGMIVMLAPRGMSHEYYLQFNPKYTNSQPVIDALRRRGACFDISATTASYATETYEQMQRLCRFFTWEDCFTPESFQALSVAERQFVERKIVQYANRARKPGHGYELTHAQDIILIKTNSSDISFPTRSGASDATSIGEPTRLWEKR